MTIIKLPEKFNEYDPETLKHLQDVYLMMLKDFIKVCDENQIEYFLDGGSALGAVRHQGFIPWDDDIDIILFRDEYNRLIEILEKSNVRKEEDCLTYKRCGGCSLRHIDYQYTLDMKRNMVQNLINKTLNNTIEVSNTIGMKKPYYYRNKLQYPICLLYTSPSPRDCS